MSRTPDTIGDVVSLIAGTNAQTNLLALKATIGSGRAGAGQVVSPLARLEQQAVRLPSRADKLLTSLPAA